MSRILFLSQLVPYPIDAGPKVRSYYVLKHLTRKHQVTLLAFSRPDDTPEAIQPPARNLRRCSSGHDASQSKPQYVSHGYQLARGDIVHYPA